MSSTARIRITRVVAPEELTAQILPKMEALGSAIGARGQRIVPKRTWALHDSFSADTQVVGATVVTTVGVGGEGVEYAMDVERGTSRMVGQPYLRPAFEQTTASDLRYRGKGITQHGIVAFSTRRARARARRRK